MSFTAENFYLSDCNNSNSGKPNPGTLENQLTPRLFQYDGIASGDAIADIQADGFFNDIIRSGGNADNAGQGMNININIGDIIVCHCTDGVQIHTIDDITGITLGDVNELQQRATVGVISIDAGAIIA